MKFSLQLLFFVTLVAALSINGIQYLVRSRHNTAQFNKSNLELQLLQSELRRANSALDDYQLAAEYERAKADRVQAILVAAQQASDRKIRLEPMPVGVVSMIKAPIYDSNSTMNEERIRVRVPDDRPVELVVEFENLNSSQSYLEPKKSIRIQLLPGEHMVQYAWATDGIGSSLSEFGGLIVKIDDDVKARFNALHPSSGFSSSSYVGGKKQYDFQPKQKLPVIVELKPSFGNNQTRDFKIILSLVDSQTKSEGQ